jgi:membrane protein DedA with SNARE-associated domain
MHDFLSLIAHYGYVIIFAIVFAEAIGTPVSCALALVAGGAAVASHGNPSRRRCVCLDSEFYRTDGN